MSNRKNRVCPVEKAGSLDTRLRRWTQNPRRLLGNYLEEGMTALDMGCGPGFFSIDMAKMVGKTGHVIAVDLQEGMLRKVRDKIRGSEIEERFTLHRCEENKIGVLEPVDFVLMFYVVHEVPDQGKLFREIKSILKPEGQVFIVEPPFHVSKKGFEDMVRIATEVGFSVVKRPKIRMSRAVLLARN